VSQRVEARLTATTVEVFLNSRRIASHRRLPGRGQASTQPAHMPHAHRAHAEWTPSRLIAWAAKTGPATAQLVSDILASRPHPEQGYRACLGVLRLGKRYGAARLEAACARALHLGAPRYRTVQNILTSGLDQMPVGRKNSIHSICSASWANTLPTSMRASPSGLGPTGAVRIGSDGPVQPNRPDH
jgi:hypothetical protein